MSHKTAVGTANTKLTTREVLNDWEYEEEIPRMLESVNQLAPKALVAFNHKTGTFENIPLAPPTISLFHMESTAILRSSPEALKDAENFDALDTMTAPVLKNKVEMEDENEDQAQEGKNTSPEEGKEVLESEVEDNEKENLPKGDENIAVNYLSAAPRRVRKAQNAFNFCETATQTPFHAVRFSEGQTIALARTEYNFQISASLIYDGYAADFEKKQKEKAKEMVVDTPIRREMAVVELADRAVNQNLYDDIATDYGYYEDIADEHRTSGSLLPLWRFHHQGFSVNGLEWSYLYQDLVGCVYGPNDLNLWDSPGYVILHTLKNPSHPMYSRKTRTGAMSLAFNPQVHHLLAVGFYNGHVAVYDISVDGKPPLFISPYKLSHDKAVSRIRWALGDDTHEQIFYSISYEGTVKKWSIKPSGMDGCTIMTVVLNNDMVGPAGVMVNVTDFICAMELDAVDQKVYRLGSVYGTITKCCIEHSEPIGTVRAHHLVIRRIQHNLFCPNLIISGSDDWTIKIWDDTREEPLMCFDVGEPVVDVSWSPYTSTVFATITADGFIHVFDLNIDRWQPICKQRVVYSFQGKEPSRMVFNPKAPVVAVGDKRGAVILLKLSPNLRIPAKPSKKEVVDPWELEVRKLQKVISYAKPKVMKLKTDQPINEV